MANGPSRTPWRAQNPTLRIAPTLADPPDGDKGDIVVSDLGQTWMIDDDVLSDFGRMLIDDADAATARTTLGLASDVTYLGSADSDLAANTAELAAAVAVPNTVVRGIPGRTYYIGAGMVMAANVFLENIRIKVKLGAGGFGSRDFSAGTRYDTAHCLIYWNGVDGGGWENLEIFGDGGGDYVCLPVAAALGFMGRPLIGRGELYIHDMPLVSAGLALNGIGDAGYDLDIIRIYNVGTDKPASYWTGSPAFTQITGIAIDTDTSVNSAKGLIRGIIGKYLGIYGAAFAGQGDQSDLLTVQGAARGNIDNGPSIGFIDAEEVNEVCDLQCRGSRIGWIRAKFCSGTVWKIPHGGNRNWVGQIYGESCGLSLVGCFGSDSVAVDEEHNIAESVTGKDHGSYILFQGTLGICTATTATLPGAGVSTIDNFYAGQGRGIRLVSGPGASTAVVPILSFVASTRIITVASWPAGTPDNTTTFRILPAGETQIATFATGSLSNPKHNIVKVDGVTDGGDMLYLAAFHGNAATSRNRVEINKDLGYQVVPTSMQSGGAGDVRPGAGMRHTARISLAGVFTVTDTAEHLVPFDTVQDDTYARAAGTGVQVVTAANGIRAALPGPKIFGVQLRGQGGANQMEITVRLYRDASLVASGSWITNTTGSQSFFVVFNLHHPESAFGSASQNLYTVRVQHSSATSWTYTATPYATNFAMSD